MHTNLMQKSLLIHTTYKTFTILMVTVFGYSLSDFSHLLLFLLLFNGLTMYTVFQ